MFEFIISGLMICLVSIVVGIICYGHFISEEKGVKVNSQFRILQDGLGKYLVQFKFMGIWWYLNYKSDTQEEAEQDIINIKRKAQIRLDSKKPRKIVKIN